MPNTHPTRRALLAAPAALLAPAARAQPAYPDHPVRYIVPFTPGGLTDVMARLVARHLQEAWAQPVVVENRPGGNALIGADFAAKSPPDGHTLLAITLTHAVNVSLYPTAPYRLAEDFAALSILGSLPLVVCVNAASPLRTLADLAAAARTRELNGGSSGNGSPPHLALELFRRATGAGPHLVHVPYRGGVPAVTDLAGGSLDLLIANLPECLAQLRGGRLRGLAVTSEARHPLVPELPTVAEAGLPELAMTNWTALVTNAAVPAPRRARIAAEAIAALADPATRRTLEEGGFTVLAWDPDRSTRFLADETARWATLVAAASIRGD